MMEMKLYFLFDEEGYFLGDSLTPQQNSTDVRPPQPCWKPKWNGTEWEEMATEEEMNPKPLPPIPTVEERLEVMESENELIKLDVTSTQVALVEVYELLLGGSVLALDTENNILGGNKMVTVYVSLIIKGVKKFEEVPVSLQEAVRLELLALGLGTNGKPLETK